MNSEKVKEIKEKLQEEIFIANSFGDKLRKVPTKELQNLLTLINELERENIQRQKLIDAYSEENERLYDDIHKKGMKGLEEQNEKNLILIDNQKDRIAELEKENKILRKHNIGYHVANNYEAQEQLKEFAERLKEKVKNFCGTEYENAYYDVTKSFACNDIDETLKEFMDGYEN